TTSVGPPAANGTTSVMGRDERSCAIAAVADVRARSVTSAIRNCMERSLLNGLGDEAFCCELGLHYRAYSSIADLAIFLYPCRFEPMSRQKIDLDRRIGRRLRLRDLLVLSTVAECGSMAKAAADLGIAQPTVSEVIADLEHTYGVRLFDRGPRGVEPTIYGHALLKRSIAVFDEIKQSGRD